MCTQRQAVLTRVDVLVRRVIPEGRDAFPELLLVESTVAILVPIGEQLDELDIVRFEDLTQLLLQADAA